MPKVVTVLNNGLETGDWWVLKLDDEIIYQGHSIPVFYWMVALELLGIPVDDKRNLTNEELEAETYG